MTDTATPVRLASFNSTRPRSCIARRLASVVSGSVRASRCCSSSSKNARRFDDSSTRPSSVLTATASSTNTPVPIVSNGVGETATTTGINPAISSTLAFSKSRESMALYGPVRMMTTRPATP